MKSVVAPALVLALATGAYANGRPALTSTINFRQGHEQHVAAGMTLGMLITHDSGATWHWFCEDAILYSGMYDPDYAYTEPGALFATTFDGFLVNRDGCTFGPTSIGKTEISQVAQAPNGTLYFSAVHPMVGTDPGDASIYTSTDNGMTMTPLGAPGLVNDWYSSLEVAPTDGNRIYITAYRFSPTGSRLFQLYRSDNAGASFTPLPTDHFTHSDNSTLTIAGIQRGAPDTVFACVDALDEAGAATIWRSVDAGQTWTQILAKPVPIAFLVRANGDYVAATQLQGAFVSRAPAHASWEPLPNAPHINVLAENSAGEVWAGTVNFASPRDNLPVSDDAAIMKTTDLVTWTKVLRLQDVAGPVDCPDRTRVYEQCVYGCANDIYAMDPATCQNTEAKSWCAFKKQYDVTSSVIACPLNVDPEVPVDAPGMPKKTGCCDAGGDDGRSALALAGVVLLIVHCAPRRTRSARGRVG